MSSRKSYDGKKAIRNSKNNREFDKKRGNDSISRPTTSANQIDLLRSERVFYKSGESPDSGDDIICPSTAPESQRSVDVVVVDVHNDNKGSEKNLSARKLFKRRNVAKDESPDSQYLSRNQRRRDFKQGNNWEIEESIEAIKEYEETNKVFDFSAEEEPEIETIDNSLKNLDNSDSEENPPQLFGSDEKFLRNSKENSIAEGETSQNRFEEVPKRRRKRWAKNEKNLSLKEELVANSSDTNQSVESEARISRVRPVPAPRRKRVSKSFDHESNLAFDNAAFRSDTEEILRIETEVYEPQGTSDGSQNYRQSTKIEMTNLYKSYERENVVFDTENEFTESLSGRDKQEFNKIQSLKTSEFLNTSNDSDTEIRRVDKDRDSQVFSAESAPETSELSENDGESNDQVLRSDSRGKLRVKEKIRNKNRNSASLDSGNSLTDISDLPRSKSRREYSRKTKSEKELKERVVKHRSKRYANKEFENDLIESNEDSEEKLTSVTIHKADVLETDFITRHPMVKVHIVDMKTGNYLKIEKGDNYERCGYLQPLITKKFDFKENRSIVPNWEEELIFNYKFEGIIQPVDKQILILFEILDLLNFAEASFNYNILGNEGCWHRIAWAFLRPVGVNGTSHINKKVRLQLYEPSKTSKKTGRLAKCEVFNWWRSETKEKYPSTLYVTLKSVDPPIEEPLVYERLSLTEFPEIEEESQGSCKKSSDQIQLPKWTRLAAQSCKIPNNLSFKTETFENGSFYVAFSNNGNYLACVGSEEGNYPIVVYTIPEGKICARFNGHTNFIYSLNWSNDDKYLLSVSSDQTGCIWDMGKKIIQHIQMLPHPAYVYCGKFYPGTKNAVVTGCYDCVVRVWTKSKTSKRYELTQELYEHKGYVNSLCFQKDGCLITADSFGVIILWTIKKKGETFSAREWRVFKIVKNTEIENIVINTIVPHPLGSRLLVHSRDDGLRMIDLDTGVILQRYKGLRNRRLQTNACLSPCGGLVLCGGEDSCLTVWSLENGNRLAKYIIKEAKIVSCVAYHPHDHILAYSTFGSVSSIRIINFDKKSTGENVGLNLLMENETIEDSDNIEITMRFDKNDILANLNANYSGRKTANISKRGVRLDAEMNRNLRTSRRPSIEISEDSKNGNSVSRRELLRLKIQRLNESEEGLKSRSAVRLNNIIEKIDRILVNTTSKKDILDSTISSNDTRRQDLAHGSSNSRRDSFSKSRDQRRSRSAKSRTRDKGSTSNTDATMELYNASMELIEMQNISSMGNISSRSEVESAGERSVYKSSSESHRKKSSKEDKLNEGSEAEVELNREKRKRRRRKGRGLSGLSDEKSVLETKSCIIELEDIKTGSQSHPSTSDSAGTYTINKEKLSEDWASDKSKANDTGSSVRSNATFTIENEVLNSRPKCAKKQ